MDYNIGDQVVFLRESGGGTIKSISQKGRFIIEDEYGFNREYLPNDIALVQSHDYQIGDDEIIIKDESAKIVLRHTKKKETLTGSRKKSEIWEIDLHVEEITESHAGLSNTEILRKQMTALRIFVDNARAKSIRKLIIIHGVGKGVLKHEVRQYFESIDAVRCFDADFRDYGKGATEVEIMYNS